MTNRDKPTLRAEIEEIVASIYYKGIHDGIDITSGNKDRFYGNKSARRDYENEFIVKKTQELAQVEAKAREEERESIFAPAREQWDKENKERTNNRKAVVDTDKQGNIYIIALSERVVGRLQALQNEEKV